MRAEAKNGDDDDDDDRDHREEGKSDSKLTSQSDSDDEYEGDSDEDTTYSEPLLALDIGAINGESEEKGGEDVDGEGDNNAR